MYSHGREKEVLIRISNISKKFGKNVVLKDCSFDIYSGEIFGLIGASGAGKTTLLRTLIGYYESDRGSILYKNKEITKNLQLIRSIMGFSTQESCFYSDLSAEDNMRYFAKMHGVIGKAMKNKIDELLKLVDLEEHKKTMAMNLSGGMQRRLDLAISIIHDPEILILDEPTTGLDPLLRKSMWNIIKKINNLGVTIIMSSHLLDEMEDLCNNVAMIQDGQIIVKGSPDQLKQYYSRHQEVWIESFPGKYHRLLSEIKLKGIAAYYPRSDGEKLIFYTPNIDTALRIIPLAANKTGEKIRELRIEKPNLSEVFEALSTYK